MEAAGKGNIPCPDRHHPCVPKKGRHCLNSLRVPLSRRSGWPKESSRGPCVEVHFPLTKMSGSVRSLENVGFRRLVERGSLTGPGAKGTGFVVGMPAWKNGVVTGRSVSRPESRGKGTRLGQSHKVVSGAGGYCHPADGEKGNPERTGPVDHFAGQQHVFGRGTARPVIAWQHA